MIEPNKISGVTTKKDLKKQFDELKELFEKRI
jgi:hypothetical protein